MLCGNSKIYAQGFFKSWFGRDDGKTQKISSPAEKPKINNNSHRRESQSTQRSGSIIRTTPMDNTQNPAPSSFQQSGPPERGSYDQGQTTPFLTKRSSEPQSAAFELSRQHNFTAVRPVSSEMVAPLSTQTGSAQLNSQTDNNTAPAVLDTILPEAKNSARDRFHFIGSPMQNEVIPVNNASQESEGTAISGLSGTAGLSSTASTGSLPGSARLSPYGETVSSEPAGNAQETLEQAWNIALEESRRLQASGFTTNAARKQIDSAKGLAMPKLVNNTSAITMNEQESITSQVSFFGMTLSPETKPLDKDFVYSVTALTVPLYLGGKVRGMIDAAKATTAALEAGQLTNEQDLKAEVTKIYFLVLRVRSLLKVAEEAERTIASHEKDATRMFDNGLLTKNVVLSAQVAHANATQDVLKARNSLHLVEAAYNRLLWRPLRTPVNIQETEIPSVLGDLDSLQAQAVAKRSELSSLASTASALSSQVQVHRGTRLPNVSLIGAHSYLESENLNPNSNLTGAISMVWMPFDGGTSRAQEESAKFQALAVARMRDDAKTAIELQVYQAWLNESETRERLLVMEKAVNQADENMRVVSRKFHEGLVNHTEVLDAQTQRTLVWNNYEHAKYDTIQAVFDLRRALGGL